MIFPAYMVQWLDPAKQVMITWLVNFINWWFDNPSQQLLAEECGMSVRTVNRTLLELESEWRIERIRVKSPDWKTNLETKYKVVYLKREDDHLWKDSVTISDSPEEDGGYWQNDSTDKMTVGGYCQNGRAYIYNSSIDNNIIDINTFEKGGTEEKTLNQYTEKEQVVPNQEKNSSSYTEKENTVANPRANALVLAGERREKMKTALEKVLAFWNKEFGMKLEYTTNLYEAFDKAEKKFGMDWIKKWVNKYVEYVDENKDWYKHRFVLITFLKQSNGLEKYFNS